ncbi:MAG: transketolase [Bacteroidetes bacterium 4572_128]|nr:MAG: transketolase [Bacteroidetes bacterium 4572_128]
MKKYIYTGEKDTRSGFGDGLLEAGKQNKNVVAIAADLTGSIKMDAFAKEFPDRFFQAGIAESNMIGVAAGMAMYGKIPFAGSFAAFSTGRVYDQIRQSVAYSNMNVKICGSHAGLTLGEDGATHQILEDIGLMKMLPNMVVINPCDYNQTKAATIEIAKYKGPVYLRFGRPEVANFTIENEKFEIGKAIVFEEGKDVTILATGHLLWEALKSKKILSKKGISAEIINIHTIKPLDEKTILKSIFKTKSVVTAEEHFMNGGLGDSIAQLLSLKNPIPMEMIAVNDTFGESGKPFELMNKYNLNTESIVKAVENVLIKKKNFFR